MQARNALIILVIFMLTAGQKIARADQIPGNDVIEIPREVGETLAP